MKMYKIERPQLEIKHDMSPESPREWCNIGYFIDISSRHICPDNDETIIEIVKETGQVAMNQEHHIKLIKKEFEDMGEKIVWIQPVTRYEHGNIYYSLGNSFGFDFSNSGFYIVTEKTLNEIGTAIKDIERVVTDELNTYNQWVNGEIYSYILYDKDGEEKDRMCGFYSISEIKNYLPKEWENEELDKYFIG